MAIHHGWRADIKPEHMERTFDCRRVAGPSPRVGVYSVEPLRSCNHSSTVAGPVGTAEFKSVSTLGINWANATTCMVHTLDAVSQTNLALRVFVPVMLTMLTAFVPRKSRTEKIELWDVHDMNSISTSRSGIHDASIMAMAPLQLLRSTRTSSRFAGKFVGTSGLSVPLVKFVVHHNRHVSGISTASRRRSRDYGPDGAPGSDPITGANCPSSGRFAWFHM